MGDVYSIFPSTTKINNKYSIYTRILSKHPRFKKVIKAVGRLKYIIPIWKCIDDAVVYSIIGQMLSLAAAESIIKRLINEFDTSRAVIAWAGKTTDIQGALNGVSGRKRKALGAWELFARHNPGIWNKWKLMPLAEYRRQLTSIWGFGRWSADMIGIFYLGRMDIWPENDAGIKKASKLVFRTDKYGSIKKYISRCETIASLYLWQMLDKKLTGIFKA